MCHCWWCWKQILQTLVFLFDVLVVHLEQHQYGSLMCFCRENFYVFGVIDLVSYGCTPRFHCPSYSAGNCDFRLQLPSSIFSLFYLSNSFEFVLVTIVIVYIGESSFVCSFLFFSLFLSGSPELQSVGLICGCFDWTWCFVNRVEYLEKYLVDIISCLRNVEVKFWVSGWMSCREFSHSENVGLRLVNAKVKIVSSRTVTLLLYVIVIFSLSFRKELSRIRVPC